MKRHVSKTISTCFYHLRRLRQLRRHADINTMKQLVSAFIFSRLVQCSSVRATSINHRPFATSAERHCSDHTWSVTARSCPSGAEGSAMIASRSLYPVQGCAFDVYGTWQSLSSVSKQIRSTSQQQPVRQRLRSASSLDFIVPLTRTKFGDRAFSVAYSLVQSAWVCQISWDSC